MNYGITGSRHGMTKAQQAVFIDAIADRQQPGFIHHGDCVGADAECHWLAFELGTSAVIHPPTDERLRAWCSGWMEMREPKPYLDRNRDIVDESDHLLAFPADYVEQPKGGTWYTIRYARAVGKPHTIVWPDGIASVTNLETRRNTA